MTQTSRVTLILATAVILMLAVACRRYPTWPDLPSAHFISGRTATSRDVRRGDAAFALERHGDFVGQPVQVEIPQYAWYFERDFSHRQPDRWRQVILIQAERTPSGKLYYGYRHDPQHVGGVLAVEEEIILLGRVNPGRIPPPGKVPTIALPSHSAEDSDVNVILGTEHEGGTA